MKNFNFKHGLITVVILLFFVSFNFFQKPKEKIVTIQVEGANYFCANKDQNYLITADKKKAFDWERFTLIYTESNKVKIKTHFGNYIYVNKNGDLQSDVVIDEDDAQTFTIVKKENGKYNIFYLGKNLELSNGDKLKFGSSSNKKKGLELIINTKQSSNKKFNLFNWVFLLISIVVVLIRNKIENLNINTKVFYIVPFFAFCYVLFRAYNLSFVIDEAMSYDILINKPYYFKALFFDSSNHYIANNHVLNTVFGYISYSIFGNHPFTFRIFNVISFIFYSYFTVSTIKIHSKSFSSFFIATVFLFLNPFMLEFFSLYRGYGLSLTFFSGLIYCFSKLYVCGFNKKTFILGLLFSTLSVYSNFALIIPVFVFLLYYFIYLNKKNPIDLIIKQKSTYFFVLCGIAILPAVSNILILSKLNELYFGGINSFLKDTLDSIINYSFYTTNKIDSVIIEIIIIIIFFKAIFFSKNKVFFSLTIIIVSIILLLTVLNHATGSKFVIERASLYFVPLLGVFMLIAWDNKGQNKGIKLLMMVSICFLTSSALMKGASSYNFYKTTTWPHDIDNDKVLNDILEINNNKRFSVAVFWIFESTINYYVDYYQYHEFVKEVKRLGSNKTIEEGYDFYYLRKSDLERVNFNYRIIKDYEKSETVIIIKERVN